MATMLAQRLRDSAAHAGVSRPLSAVPVVRPGSAAVRQPTASVRCAVAAPEKTVSASRAAGQEHERAAHERAAPAPAAAPAPKQLAVLVLGRRGPGGGFPQGATLLPDGNVLLADGQVVSAKDARGMAVVQAMARPKGSTLLADGSVQLADGSVVSRQEARRHVSSAAGRKNGDPAAAVAAGGDDAARPSSSYSGVRWRELNQMWTAQVDVARRLYHLGYFRRQEDAARAFDRAKAAAYNDGRVLYFLPNFPEEWAKGAGGRWVQHAPCAAHASSSAHDSSDVETFEDAVAACREASDKKKRSDKDAAPYPGLKVVKVNSSSKWDAVVRFPGGTELVLGHFSDPDDAARAIDRVTAALVNAERYPASDVHLNFPHEWRWDGDGARLAMATWPEGQRETVLDAMRSSGSRAGGKPATSLYNQVVRHARAHTVKWEARVADKLAAGNYRHVGLYETEEEAARAVDIATVEKYNSGYRTHKRLRLNFPDEYRFNEQGLLVPTAAVQPPVEARERTRKRAAERAGSGAPDAMANV